MYYNPSSEDFDALVYNAPHPGTLNYMQAKLSSLSSNLTGMGQQFMAGVRETWERFNGSEALRRARAVKRKVQDALFMRNEIQPMSTLGQLQNANLLMQNWIMSEPTVRKAFHMQRCDGFSSTYIDPNPGCIGEDDYNYRQVMQGIVTDTEDGGWKVTVFFDDVKEGGKPLDIEEQSDILVTWDAVKTFLERGKEDPTSAFGGWL